MRIWVPWIFYLKFWKCSRRTTLNLGPERLAYGQTPSTHPNRRLGSSPCSQHAVGMQHNLQGSTGTARWELSLPAWEVKGYRSPHELRWPEVVAAILLGCPLSHPEPGTGSTAAAPPPAHPFQQGEDWSEHWVTHFQSHITSAKRIEVTAHYHAIS